MCFDHSQPLTPTLGTPPGSFNISPQPHVLAPNHCLIMLQQMTLHTKNIGLHFKDAKHSYMTLPGFSPSLFLPAIPTL